MSVIAKQGTISVRATNPNFLEGGTIMMNKAFGDGDLWHNNMNTLSTKIAHLYSGSKRNFVFEMKVGAIKHRLPTNKFPIALAKCKIQGIDGKWFNKEVSLFIKVHKPNQYRQP